MNIQDTKQEILKIAKRNQLFDNYCDDEEGSFSEGEKLMASLDEYRQALVEEIRRQVGYKDIFDILDSIYPDPTPSEGGEK